MLSLFWASDPLKAVFCLIIAFIMMKWTEWITMVEVTEKRTAPYNKLCEGDIALNYQGELKDPWRVVTAANRHKESGLIVVGARHFDKLMRAQIFALQGFDKKTAAEGHWGGMSSSVDWKDMDQGFIDNFGDYLTRKQAYVLAKYNGQLLKNNDGRCHDSKNFLYSENIH